MTRPLPSATGLQPVRGPGLSARARYAVHVATRLYLGWREDAFATHTFPCSACAYNIESYDMPRAMRDYDANARAKGARYGR